jgi:hypothetical protein
MMIGILCLHITKKRTKYTLLLTEIADAQRKDQELKVYFKKSTKMPQKDIGLHLIEDTKVLCKKWKINDSYISKAQGS